MRFIYTDYMPNQFAILLPYPRFVLGEVRWSRSAQRVPRLLGKVSC